MTATGCDVQTPEFQQFFDKNKNWLEPYALFCVLRKLFGTTEHWRWGTLSTPTPDVRLPIILCFVADVATASAQDPIPEGYKYLLPV